MTTATANEVKYLCDAANGYGPMIELNGTRLEVRKENVGSTKTWRRVFRYGVQVAPNYNQSGIEWVSGRNVASVIKKLTTDRRTLVGAA
jgi:hypothetical protein